MNRRCLVCERVGALAIRKKKRKEEQKPPEITLNRNTPHNKNTRKKPNFMELRKFKIQNNAAKPEKLVINIVVVDIIIRVGEVSGSHRSRRLCCTRRASSSTTTGAA